MHLQFERLILPVGQACPLIICRPNTIYRIKQLMSEITASNRIRECFEVSGQENNGNDGRKITSQLQETT